MDDKFRIENRIITNLDKASAEETDLSQRGCFEVQQMANSLMI